MSVAISGSVTLDESPGLQTGGSAVLGEDNNDSDVAVGSLPSNFSSRLFGSPSAGLGLSNAFATQVGVGKSADNYITVSATGTLTSLGFTKTDGSALPVYAGVAAGGIASGLNAATGGAISLFADASLGNRMVLGVDTTNQISLAMFMEPSASLTSAKVWTVQFEPVANPDATNPDDPATMGGVGVAAGSSIVFTFDQLHSGSNLFGTVGDATNSLIVIAEKPKLKANGTLDSAGQAVKTSQGGTGATIGIDSQMIDPGEGAFFTYVKGSDPNFLAAALDQGEANDSAAILYSGGTLAANGASVTISQTQGPTPGTMTVAAFDVAGTPQQKPFVDGIINGTGIGAAVAITSVTIHKANGTTVSEAAAGPNTSANISFAGGVATVSGLGSGDRIAWTTSATHDRVLIKGVAGKFDVGAFGVDEPSAHLSPLTGIRYEDDGPSITGTLVGAPSLIVDETNVAAPNATGAFAGQFTPVFGSDGQGATPVGYALSTPGGASGLVDTATGQAVNLSLVSGQVQGRTATSDELVFTVSVNASGVVSLDQLRAVVHPTSDPDESKTLSGANLVVLTATANDKDADTAATSINIGQQLVFKDDGPSIAATAVGAPTLTVDESNLAAPNATGAFAAQFTPAYGADGQGATPVGYALSTPGGASGLVDTASGQNVVLSLTAGGVVEGRTATSGLLVFTVSVNASGVVSLDQLRAIVHPTNDPDESKTLSAANLVVLTATATDKDGDSAATSLNIGQQLVFKDDGPAIGPIDSSIVDLVVGATVTKSLNGAVGADANAAPYTIDSFTASITINGIELRGVLSGNKQVVTYFRDTNNDTIFGNTGDTAFYRLTLNQSGAGTYTFDVLATPPPATVSFNFEDLPSGQNLFGMIGDPATGLVVIGKVPVLNADGTYTNASNTINTSQGGGGTTIGVNNQMFDPGEGAYFTFVKDPNAEFLGVALDPGEADDADNIQFGETLEVTSGFLKVVQTQGGGAKTLKITAFNIQEADDAVDGTGFVGALGDGTVVNITEVMVNGVAISGIPAGGLASVNVNIKAGDTVAWKTSGVHDQILIEGVAGKWDIGGFGTTQVSPTPDQKLDFVAKVVDGDGDSQTASFSIGIDGTGIFDDSEVDGVSSLFSSKPIDDLDDLLA